MRSFRLVSLLAVTAVPTLFANACITDTLANYILLGTTGCTVGYFNVKDFNFTVISSTVRLTASNITVSPTTGAVTSNVDFSSSLFAVFPADSIKIEIDYFLDPGSLSTFDDVMYDPVIAPALSQLTIDGCENSNLSSEFVRLNRSRWFWPLRTNSRPVSWQHKPSRHLCPL